MSADEASNDSVVDRENSASEVPVLVENDYDECIRIGPEYQADVPDYSPPLEEEEDDPRSDRGSDMIQWIPTPDLGDVAIEVYVQKSRKLYGYEEEQALGMLLFHDYDFEKAFADQIHYVPDWEEWTCEEKVLFKEAFNFHGKDFDKYESKLPTKSLGAIVKYYYLHKKHKRRRGSSSKCARAEESLVDGKTTDQSSGCCLDQSQDESACSTADVSRVDDVDESSMESDYPRGDSVLEEEGEEEEEEEDDRGNDNDDSQCSVEEIRLGDGGKEDSRSSSNSGGTKSEEEKRRVSVLPPLTFLQLLGCSKCSLYFGTSHGQKIHMEKIHGSRAFTPEEAAFDFERLKASEGADHLLAECACIACGLFFLDPLLKKKHLTKFHPEVKHEAVRSKLPFDLGPAHTSHNHLKCNECGASFMTFRAKYDHNRKIHSMKFDYPDVQALLAAESRAAVDAARDQRLAYSSQHAGGPLSAPTPTWSNREIVDVLEAIRLHGPNFFLIAGKVPTKTVNQIRKFYFVNKRRYNLDRMDRRPFSGPPSGEEGSSKDVEGGGDAGAEMDPGGGGGVDCPFGPAEFAGLRSPSASRAADCGDAAAADCGDAAAAESIETPPESSFPPIPPEPRPVRQARARRMAKYVQEEKSSSSEEEEVAESDDERKNVSDDETSDPNFVGEEEEEEEEEEGSEDSDREEYGRGKKRRRKTSKLFHHSLLAPCHDFGAVGTPLSIGTSTASSSTSSAPSSATVTPSTHLATCSLASRDQGRFMNDLSRPPPRPNDTTAVRNSGPCAVSSSGGPRPNAPARVFQASQLGRPAVAPQAGPRVPGAKPTPARPCSCPDDACKSIIPSMQPWYKNTSLSQNLVQFFPPTRPLSYNVNLSSAFGSNLVALRGTCFYASSSFSLETNGPARAVTVRAGDCWKGGNSVMPQVFQCQLTTPKVAGRLLYQVIEGVNSGMEFADPCSFRFEGKKAPGEDWIALFLVNNAAQLKGRDLIFNFDNRIAFQYYRMVIFKTMSSHPRAKPALAGLRLMEFKVPDS